MYSCRVCEEGLLPVLRPCAGVRMVCCFALDGKLSFRNYLCVPSINSFHSAVSFSIQTIRNNESTVDAVVDAKKENYVFVSTVLISKPLRTIHPCVCSI